jgi:hypothetical protein
MESFESEVANYYKLEKKFLTTPFYSHTICLKRDFLRFDTAWNGKQFPQYWKNDPEEGGKTCMKQSFCRHNWSDWDWISRKIILKSPIWLQEKKLVDNFKGLETMI